MSRETAKTQLESDIAALNSNKNWHKGVSGTYSVVSQPNSSDFGADKTSTAGDFTIVFPTADSSNAIIRIA